MTHGSISPQMLEIVPYQLDWPADFERLAGMLRAALGQRALRVDHIGSTAVPGLSAKDVIDIQVTVEVLSADIALELRPAGFEQRGDVRVDHVPPGENADCDQWSKLLFTPPESERRAHVHVRVAGRRNQRYALLFRDYLRAHPATAEAYAELKRRLAASLADPKDYPEVKDPAVDLIYLAAQAWAAQCAWTPAPN